MLKKYHFNQPPAIVVGACGHGLAIIHALHEGQVPIIALEANLNLPGVHTKLAQIVHVNDINGSGLIGSLLALRPLLHCPGKPLIFLTNDNMVQTMAANWTALQPHYLLSWAHCRDKVAMLLEKRHLEAHCKNQGLTYPLTYQLNSQSDIDSAIAAVGPFVIVKPTRPLAGFKVSFVRGRTDYEQLIQRFAASLPFLVQKYIPGDDTSIYFCALYLDHGEVLGRFDGRKLRSRPLGHTTIAESCIQEDVYQETLRFFKGLKLSGPVSLELKRDSEGHLWVIEPTVGRTDFWLGLCTANQINLPLMEYRNLLCLTQERVIQTNEAVWFNEERDPLGRLWLARHPNESLGGRRTSYIYHHRKDIAPALFCQRKILFDLLTAGLRRIRKLVNAVKLKKSAPYIQNSW